MSIKMEKCGGGRTRIYDPGHAGEHLVESSTSLPLMALPLPLGFVLQLLSHEAGLTPITSMALLAPLGRFWMSLDDDSKCRFRELPYLKLEKE
jgi:hypothetical protein